jgi:hypothetical protein
MEKEEYIRDFNTRQIIGIIRTKSNGDQVAIDFATRKILGFYRASRDATTDFLGRVLTKGNSVVSLIYKNKK